MNSPYPNQKKGRRHTNDRQLKENTVHIIAAEWKVFESIGDKFASKILFNVLRDYPIPYFWYQKLTELFTSNHYWKKAGEVVGLPDRMRVLEHSDNAFEVCISSALASPPLSSLLFVLFLDSQRLLGFRNG